MCSLIHLRTIRTLMKDYAEMPSSGKNKYREIISGLVSEFWAENGDTLKKDCGHVQQDLISSGRFNTTRKVSKLLELHYQYLNIIVDFLTDSIEKNYAQLRPAKCKKYLVQIVDSEYENLGRKVPDWLHSSQILDEKTLAMYEDGVIAEKEKSRASLENKCALWEERWKRKRRKRSVKILFLAITAILIPVLGWFVPKWISGKNGEVKSKPAQKKLKVLPVDPNTGKTALNVRTTKRVEELGEFIIKEKIDPWLFVAIQGLQVTKADGGVIACSGLEYSGSLIKVFWSQDYIDPFLETGIQKVLDETGQECKTNDLRAEEPLKEAAALLTGLIWNIYDRMAEVDSILRKKSGDSEKVSKRNVEERIKVMDKKLREHLRAALELYSDSSQ